MTQLSFPFDLILRNGTLIDGTGTPARRADVGICVDKTSQVSISISRRFCEKIDAICLNRFPML